MADITSLQQGEVEDSGKVNWRGDQVDVPQGGQSVYKTSSVPLVQLGARKVVGDRVFRYAQAAGAIGAGDVAETGATSVISVTAGGTDPAGGKKFTWYSATAVAANYWAEGGVHISSGTAANLGHCYRIKSHGAIATTSTGALTLYDSLVKANDVTDEWSIRQNLYKGLTECTAGTNTPVGVCPVLVASSDYFWLQTWGPICVKGSAISVAGRAVCAGATGQVQDAVVATTADPRAIIGYSLQTHTASEYGMTYLTIAP